MELHIYMRYLLPILLSINLFHSYVMGQEVSGARYHMKYPMMFNKAFIKSPYDSLKIQSKMEESMWEFIDFIRIENDLVQLFWKYDGSLDGIKVYSNFNEKTYHFDVDGNLSVEKIKSRSTIDYGFIESEGDSLFVYSISQYKGVAVKVWVCDRITHSKNEYNNSFGMQPEISLFTQLHLSPSQIVIGNTAMVMEWVSNVSYSQFQTKQDYLEFLNGMKSKKKRLLLRNDISFKLD